MYMKMQSKHAMMSMLLAIRAKASTAATVQRGKCPFTDHRTRLLMSQNDTANHIRFLKPVH